jgi:hypothetical protein
MSSYDAWLTTPPDDNDGEELWENTCGKCQFYKPYSYVQECDPDIFESQDWENCPLVQKFLDEQAILQDLEGQGEYEYYDEQQRDDQIERIMERRKRRYYSAHPAECPECMGARWTMNDDWCEEVPCQYCNVGMATL